MNSLAPYAPGSACSRAPVSVCPSCNHTGIVIKMFLFSSLVKRMGILSNAFFLSWCLRQMVMYFSNGMTSGVPGRVPFTRLGTKF